VPANITLIDSKVLAIKIKPGRDSLPEDVFITQWNITSKVFSFQKIIGFKSK